MKQKKKMPTIKFSHDYLKLDWFPFSRYPHALRKTAKLVVARLVELENLPKEFLEYDTAYVDFTSGKPTVKQYPLPKKGIYILLLFIDGTDRIFTTLRRSTPKKLEYYKSLQGQEFQVEITEEKRD